MTALLSEPQQMLVQSEPSSWSCCTQLCCGVLCVCWALPLQGARLQPELGDGEKDKWPCQNSPLTSYLLIGILGDCPPGRVSSKEPAHTAVCLKPNQRHLKEPHGACQELHPERGCRDSEGEGARQEDTQVLLGSPSPPQSKPRGGSEQSL